LRPTAWAAWSARCSRACSPEVAHGLADGLLFGNPRQLMIQAVAVGAALVYSGLMTFVLLKLIGAVMPLRATADDEQSGWT
jgi:Amt family ammonium transporter